MKYSGSFITSPSEAIFNLILSHSHLLTTIAISFWTKYRLFKCFTLIYYTPTSLQCRMDLPNPFFRQGPFFFSGLTAGPTHRPLVRHSNANTPLISLVKKRSAVKMRLHNRGFTSGNLSHMIRSRLI